MELGVSSGWVRAGGWGAGASAGVEVEVGVRIRVGSKLGWGWSCGAGLPTGGGVEPAAASGSSGRPLDRMHAAARRERSGAPSTEGAAEPVGMKGLRGL